MEFDHPFTKDAPRATLVVPMTAEPVLVLFTGLGADERLLQPQHRLPYTLITPPWIEPDASETLPAYARRMANTVDWPARFVLGGVSFGGMVAAELAPLLKPAGLVLVSTCLYARSIPSVSRFINALTKAVEGAGDPSPVSFSRLFLNIFAEFSEEVQCLMADMLHQTSVNLLRWASHRILDWEGAPPPPCPRIWIHGGRDLVIPVRKVGPDVVIPDGGHLINWTHAEQVNQFIREFVGALKE
ncbi:MAG: alpha/beta hydrolase [Planctomycetota bacterium]